MSHNRKGVTLVEVILALALFGIVALVLSQGFNNTLNSLATMTEVANDDDAIRFVRQEVVHIADRDELDEGGEVTLVDGRIADWEAEIEPGPVTDLFYLTIEIRIEPLEVDQEVTEATEELMVLRPDWSIDEDRADILEENRQRLEERRRNLDFDTGPLR